MSIAFQEEQKLVWQFVAPGVQRKIMNYNPNIMMVKVQFEKGAVGDLHQHPHIQSSFVAEGSFDVTIDGVTKLLQKGDTFFVAPNLVHGVVCKEAGVLIDVFNPCREDFL
jgi:quercetin dioxygenase-like cupin family protein